MALHIWHGTWPTKSFTVHQEKLWLKYTYCSYCCFCPMTSATTLRLKCPFFLFFKHSHIPHSLCLNFAVNVPSLISLSSELLCLKASTIKVHIYGVIHRESFSYYSERKILEQGCYLSYLSIYFKHLKKNLTHSNCLIIIECHY